MFLGEKRETRVFGLPKFWEKTVKEGKRKGKEKRKERKKRKEKKEEGKRG